MKFTLSWLKDHLETEASLEEILTTLTMIGLEVEEADDRSELAPFVIARVIEAKQHPDADRLRVCMVDAGPDINGGSPVQVVCGAPNARTGLVGVFAPPGTRVPGTGVDLKPGVIRGVESNGMLCSERELMLSDDHHGIIDLDDAPASGTPYAHFAGLDDPVIDIGLTPNRPDCTGVYGIARDLAAAGLGTLKSETLAPVAAEEECPTKVTLDFGDTEPLCPAFGLRLVRGVKNGPSPQWMQRRLLAIGLRPINALVDITNYLTFDRGRPLHVFDLKKTRGDLVVRRAYDGEKIQALDGRDYTLDPSMVVIADENGPESIGGIMGGEESGCDEDTTDVLIESALWDPMNIARTGRTLGIITDARYRFERGVDPAFMMPGLDLATKLVTDLCGGTPTKAHIAGTVPTPELIIGFPVSEVERLTGLAIDAREAKAILTLLGFWVSGGGDVLKVAPPSWRPDVHGKADLVEEIMRIRGVDSIPNQPLVSHQTVNAKILTTRQIRERKAKRALASRGLNEAVTWSFVSKKQAELFGGGAAELELANPISADMSDMRPSLLPALLAAAGRNADRGYPNTALFEVGQIFKGDRPGDQLTAATGVRRGSAAYTGAERHWSGNSANVSVFDARADAFTVLEALGAQTDKFQIERKAPGWFHPGRSGQIQLGPKVIIGWFGELHPALLEELDIDGPLCGFELILENIPEPRAKATKSKGSLDVPDLMPLRRDFAFIVDHDVAAQTILRAARGADKKLIQDVSVFDIYEGKGVEDGKKSIALEVLLQPTEKTLNDEDLEAFSTKFIAAVEKASGGVLRGG